MKGRVFILFFLIIIYGVFITFPISYLTNKTIDASNLTEYEPIEENNIIDKLSNKYGNLKNSLENRINNYFPFYNSIVSLYENINFYSNILIYNDVPIKKNSDGDYIFYDKTNELYYLKMSYSNEELEERLNEQVNFFNELNNNGLDISIYIPTRMDLTTLKDNNLNEYVYEFVDLLNDNINISIMDISTIEEYKKYFFKTDHHWTMYGAIEGYYNIMNMLEVPPIENLETITYEQPFYGSMAKSARSDIISDYISDITIKLEYDVSYNGDGANLSYKPRTLNKSNNDFYDYYVQYFNGSYGEVVYDYHDESKENLLILSDSYAWEIDYLIAEGFNKTYVINLRYDEYKDNNFYIYDYIKENNIDKVLFLYNGTSTIFDNYNYNLKERIK